MPRIKAFQNQCFREANAFRGRYRVLMGSAGSGKSVNVAQDFILKLGDPRNEGANLLVIRKTEASHRTSTYAELVGAIYRIYGEYADMLWQIKQSPMEIRSRKTGNTIIFRGMADDRQRERLKSITAPTGGGITWIWCEEATELYKNDFDILDTRLRGDLPNPELFYQITISFNPISASHWLKGRFFDKVNPKALTHVSTYQDNIFIDPDYRDMLEQMKINNPAYYRVYGLGEWGETEGQILPHFKVRRVNPDPLYYDAISLGTDFGYNHAHATLVLGWKDGVVYVINELWVKRKDMNDIAAMMEEKLGRYKGYPMYCDSASPERRDTLKKNGWLAMSAYKGPNSVLAQIGWLQGTQLVIAPECTKTLWEIGQWVWLTDKRTGEYLDEPVSKDDDAMAALRYGVQPWRKGPAARAVARPVGM